MRPALIFQMPLAWCAVARSTGGASATPASGESFTPEPPPTDTHIPAESELFTSEDAVNLAARLRGRAGQVATPRASQGPSGSFEDQLSKRGLASVGWYGNLRRWGCGSGAV